MDGMEATAAASPGQQQPKRLMAVVMNTCTKVTRKTITRRTTMKGMRRRARRALPQKETHLFVL